MTYYGGEKKTVGPGTDSVMKRTLVKGGSKTNNSAGKDYKKDFSKEGTECPAAWGNSLKGSPSRG